MVRYEKKRAEIKFLFEFNIASIHPDAASSLDAAKMFYAYVVFYVFKYLLADKPIFLLATVIIYSVHLIVYYIILISIRKNIKLSFLYKFVNQQNLANQNMFERC